VTKHHLSISIRPSEDGEGLDVDAHCDCYRSNGTASLPGWVWSGWAETPQRAANYAATEWDTHVNRAL
jgi:hypothetical protein